jgi:prolyl-tRNA synthetase
MGALIMAHSDDNGLVLPPKLAPIQVVIIPIHKTPEDLETISATVSPLVEELRAAGVSVKYDDSENQRSGWKFAEYELRGVPIRLGLGMRDLENGTVEVARRDNLTKESVALDTVVETVRIMLEQIQQSVYQKALRFREENTHTIDTWEDFQAQIEKGGFILAHWDGTAETEEKIKNETKATIRCIPLNAEEESGKCVYSGNASTKRVVFARAY